MNMQLVITGDSVPLKPKSKHGQAAMFLAASGPVDFVT